MPITKACSKCGEIKEASEYTKSKIHPLGIYSSCKSCKAAYSAIRSKRPSVKLLSAEATRRCKKRNPEKYKERKLAWRKNNIEYVRKKAMEQHFKHHAHRLAALKAAYAARRGGGKREKAEAILAMMEAQRGKCAICACSIRGKYHLDHVMPLKLGGRSEMSNYQLLCPPCNLHKRDKHPIDYMQQLGRLL